MQRILCAILLVSLCNCGLTDADVHETWLAMTDMGLTSEPKLSDYNAVPYGGTDYYSPKIVCVTEGKVRTEGTHHTEVDRIGTVAVAAKHKASFAFTIDACDARDLAFKGTLNRQFEGQLNSMGTTFNSMGNTLDEQYTGTVQISGKFEDECKVDLQRKISDGKVTYSGTLCGLSVDTFNNPK